VQQKKKMAKITEYINEAYTELVTKVTWPTWKELQDSAVIVAVASMIFALVVFVMDYLAGANGTQYWKGLLGMFYEYVVKG
jgi:preprotein translocase subunit SecE